MHPDPGIFSRILQHCDVGHFSESKKKVKKANLYKVLRYGPRVTRGSHSFTCHPHTNHTCLYSTAARHHRPFNSMIYISGKFDWIFIKTFITDGPDLPLWISAFSEHSCNCIAEFTCTDIVLHPLSSIILQ